MHRSLYASPGCRAFGFDRLLAGHGIYDGLHVSTAARTAFVEVLRMPMFGMATQKVSEKDGGKPQEHLFLGLALIHPPGEPDKCGVLGLWVHNGAADALETAKARLRQTAWFGLLERSSRHACAAL